MGEIYTDLKAISTAKTSALNLHAFQQSMKIAMKRASSGTSSVILPGNPSHNSLTVFEVKNTEFLY